MRVFMIVLMILVGVVFVIGPAGLLAGLTPNAMNITWWTAIIIIYYVIATLLPIDKIIGKIYPIFGVCLLFMAVGIMLSIFYYQPHLTEIWENIQNTHPNAQTRPIFPMMFISIACGAISGFHATQSPLMARCMTNEKQGRVIFFGAMIAEGIVALIWAAAASWFFYEKGFDEKNPAIIVDFITKNWLGSFGAVLAVLGVVFAPITSGDTAFRSARLIIADFLHMDQKPIAKRLTIAIPLFVVAFLILLYSIFDANGFDTIWRYFAWANQTLAVFTLWAITVYLTTEKKTYIITLIPALFMTMVCSTFILISKNEGFGLNANLSYAIAGLMTIGTLIYFLLWKKKTNKISPDTIKTVGDKRR
jgi:carbon starvation protein CstA